MEHSGRIIKGIGSFYTVMTDEGEFVCKARGKFRKIGTSPVPGDMVTFEVVEDGKGYLSEILPRKNILVRPAVSNVDKLMIVMAASLPKPDLSLTDKLLVQCEIAGIIPVIILNKCDEQDGEIMDAVLSQYGPCGYTVLSLSAETGEGMEALKAEIKDNICCFAGQSAVGKSSLMNALAPELCLAVGRLSEKTDRGRHTTRHAELWQVCGGAMLDTPGFSLLDTAELEPADLCKYYPEMREHLGECRFPECVHITEPDCGVKTLVGSRIHPERYSRYCKFVEELKEKRRHRYD